MPFIGWSGPAQWAKARLVRYADDFVVLARDMSRRLQHGHRRGTGRMAGTANQPGENTVSVELTADPDQSLDFLGYTFRYERDRLGPGQASTGNLTPSRKALARERQSCIRKSDGAAATCHCRADHSNSTRHLRGWARYFSLGYPRKAMRNINAYVLSRLDAASAAAQSTRLDAPDR